MADGVKLSESLARRTKKVVETVENWRNPKNGRQYPRNPQEDSPLWYNNSGETAPPFAAFEVSDVDIVGGRIVLQGIKPTGTAGKAIFFNFRVAVPAADSGVYQPGPIFRARFSNGTGANAVAYGPVASSWELSTAGTGFESVGKIDDETNDMLARELVSSDSYPIIIAHRDQLDTALTSTPTGFLGGAVDYNSDTGVFLPLGGTSGIRIVQNGYYLADISASFYLPWVDVAVNTQTAVDFDQQSPAKITSTLSYNPLAGWVHDDAQPLFFPADLVGGGMDASSEPRQITMHYCEVFEVTSAPQTQNVLFSKQTGNADILNLSWSIQKLS